MEKTEERPEVERPPSPLERGLLHMWHPGAHCEQLSPERVLLSRPVLQTALGENHGLLLSQGGLVYSFGELLWRALSVPLDAPVPEVSLQGRAVVRVAAGGFHCGAVTSLGTIYMWGENTAGQCGLDSSVTVPEPSLVSVVDSEAVPPAAVRLTDVACGREHSLALSAQNELWAWGSGCQLGLVTKTFPVYRPQKVEHLAGRHVIQVACGAYHSLALVRNLAQQQNNTPKPCEKTNKERRQSSHSFLSDKVDSFVMEDSHYCPLGVELSGECPRRSVSRRSQVTGRDSALSSSPGSASNPHASRGQALSSVHSEQNSLCTKLDFDESSDQTDFTSKPTPHWRHNKKSQISKEQDLQSLLYKLSIHSIDIPRTPTSSDTESMSASADSCASSTPSSDFCSSSYKDESPPKSQTNHFGPYSSSPVCVDEVRLCLRDQSQSLCVGNSSSLTDIREKSAENRRRSLPGTPSHGSPRRRQVCACGTPCPGHRSGGSEAAGDGLPCLDTEVWSWGRGSEGQLGHGDQLARLQPMCIKALNGEEVIKVAAGSHHSLAVTAHCQMFSWGSNMCGQLGHVNSPLTVPKQAKLSEGIRVWDVSAGQSHSLLLADGDCVQPVLLYCGQQQEPKTEKCETPPRSQRSPRRSESYTVRPALMPFCMEMGYISSVHSGGQSCAVLSDQNIMGFISAIHELASRERHFYCWLRRVSKVLLTPLRAREGVNPYLGDPGTRLFLSVCDKFVPLSLLIGRHSAALSYFLHDLQSCDVTALPLLSHTDQFLHTFKQYCSSVGDFQVMGGFQSLQKLANDCLGSKNSDLRELSVSDSDKDDLDMGSLLYWPLQQLHHYSRLLLKLAACYDVLTAEYHFLHQGCSQFEALSSSLLKKKKEAETTCNFWKTHSGKTTELLRLPHRRVVCESSNRSLTLQNAGRFSNHWFILFNDALVHTQGTIPSQSFFSTHHVYPLTCLWVKPVTENNNGLYAIKIICPEETFTLVASTPQEKNKWLRALNQAVDQVLGGGGQGLSPGMTAMTRKASYSFTAEGRFKDAQYKGNWQTGRVHGRGTMKWPDGRTYIGNFKNGLEDGYGECLMPNKALNKADCYQGQWKDGQIHGFGKFKYAAGEVYEGCFFEGQRHGYGMLSSGRLARSTSSVFIGRWVHDRKMGYGVYDDITSGQKYMGMWVDDQRHGNAAVVTQHGLYFEGTFKDNKMSGPGLLVSDDDTTFHGEFSDDWTINGKGLLHLANGDFLDGEFSGEWASLKVTGSYTKPAADEPESKERNKLLSLGQYVVPAGERWTCVFDECWGRLGCEAPAKGQKSVAWDNIAVSIATTRRQTYAAGEVYEGCFFEGQRHGYGMLSSGRLARSTSSVFIGRWVHDRKMGYGVYDDITSGQKYMGMWVDDQRHGNAAVVTQHGLYFEGTFKDNKMSGPGLLVSDDDTTFHGEFSDDWTINGKGLLHLANGDFLDGEFSGEWASLKVTGSYTKPAADEPESKERNKLLSLGQYVVPAGERWTCVFDECWGRLGCEAPAKGQKSVAWDNIAVSIATTRRQTLDLSKSQSKILESLELIPQHEEAVTTGNYDNIRKYLAKACETPLHPLGWLVETLVTAYRMTYVGSNRRLLRQAVREVQAYLTHFYSIVRFLFPGLPDDGSIIPDPPATPSRRKQSFVFNTVEQTVVVVSCSSLLLPLLLPRLYPPLFTLYCLQEEQDEAKYWERILRLNKSPDQALLSFLGVHEKFWPVWMSILGEKKQIVSSSKDACYASAVETLQQISTTFTPSDKLTVIQKTFEELTQEVKPLVEESFMWSMDDLFPLFLYVVLRARIRNLGAEVSLIEDLMDPNLEHGEMGLMFTTLKACYIQIQQESMM